MPAVMEKAYSEEFKNAFRNRLANKGSHAQELEEMGAVRCFHCWGEGEIKVIIHCQGCTPEKVEFEQLVCICPIEKTESCIFCRGTGEMYATECECYGPPGPGPRIDKFSGKSLMETVSHSATYFVSLPAKLDLENVAYILRRHKTAEDAVLSLRKKKCVIESREPVRIMNDQFSGFEVFCITKNDLLLGGIVRRYEIDDPEVPKIVIFLEQRASGG